VAAVLYVPAAQYAQGPPVGPAAPALQVQNTLAAPESESTGQFLHTVDTLAARVSEYLPDPQSVQKTEPAAMLYFPAGHATHAALPGSALYVPASQSTHWCALAAPYVPTGHISHTALEFPPTTVDNLPASQLMHESIDTCPFKTPYVPRKHGIHGADMS